MKSIRGLSFVVVGVGIALVVSGCAGSTASTPTPKPSNSAVTNTPSPDPIAPAAWPAKLVDTTCDELAPVVVRDAVFARSLPPRSGGPNPSAQMFTATAFDNAGGLACEWEESAGTGNFEDDMAVSVMLLPRAQAAAERISQEMGSEKPITQLPDMYCNWRACMNDQLIGEYWLSVMVRGFPTPPEGGIPPAEAVQLRDAAVAAVHALAPSAEPMWPSTHADWPTSCEQFVAEESLGQALNLPDAKFTNGYNYEGGNIGNAAILTSGGLVCGLATQSGSRIGGIEVLPESADRFAVEREAALESANVEAVQVEGLGVEDAFITHRVDMPGSALLDMNLNGTWVALSVAGSIFEAPEASAEERLLGLASSLAAAQ